MTHERPLRRRRDGKAAAVALDVAVARYAEELNWTRKLPASARVWLYDKRGDLPAERFPWARVVRLENVGVEAHTYISHIIEMYQEVAAVTLFCQGWPFDHCYDLQPTVHAVVEGRESVTSFRWLGHILDTDDAHGRRLFTRWSKNADGRELAVGEFHRELFGEPLDGLVHFRPGAQFIATAGAIRSRPLAFWRRALELAVSFPDAGHCFERLWDRVFGVRAIDPAELGPDGCRYLKPIRRLGTAAR